MHYVRISILLLANTIFLLFVPFGLPGNWLMVIAVMLFARHQDSGIFSTPTLVAVCAMALAGEVVEFFAAAGGAKRAGGGLAASAAAILGAIAGAIVGTVALPIPVVGTILGASVGAGLAAWAVEVNRGRHSKAAVRAGVGAGLGHLGGTVVKFALGVAIWLTIAVAAFWP